MEMPKDHIRHVLLYEYNKHENATTATKNICEVYGKSIISVSQSQRWFKKFRSGNTNLQDEGRSGRPMELDDDLLTATVEQNPVTTIEKLAKGLDSTKTTIHRHLKRINKVSKLSQRVPHELSANNRKQRIIVCKSLLSRLKLEPFLNRIITGDEKWVFYHNVKRQRQWLSPRETGIVQPKSGLHPKKVLLSVWWDMDGIIYYELMKSNQTINTEVYCNQLDRLKQALAEKRPALLNRRGVLFHQDNARPHVAKATLKKLRTLEWEVMSHPPYSPDIAPSDYHLFRSLQNFLDGLKMDTVDEVKTVLNEFFESRSKDFYKRGIENLPVRWKHIVQNEGSYFI